MFRTANWEVSIHDKILDYSYIEIKSEFTVKKDKIKKQYLPAEKKYRVESKSKLCLKYRNV